MRVSNHTPAKLPGSHLHMTNLIVATLAGIISIVGGIYSLKATVFSSQAYGSLQGVVRDEKIAKPLLLAKVEITTPDGAVVNTVDTNQEGHYLVETIKAGNYLVKFSAPRHITQSETIKIEKNLTSTINVDLVPVEEPTKTVSADGIPQNFKSAAFPAPYPNGVAIPNAISAPVPNTAAQETPVIPQSYDSSVPSSPQIPHTHGRYPRHPRRDASANSYDTPAGTSQTQGSNLTQVGIQLLQDYLSKKSSEGPSSSSQ